MNRNVKTIRVDEAEVCVTGLMCLAKILSCGAAAVQKGIAHLVPIGAGYHRVRWQIRGAPVNIAIADLRVSVRRVDLQGRADVGKRQQDVQKSPVAFGVLAALDF